MLCTHAATDGAGLVLPGLMPVIKAEMALSYTDVGALYFVSLLTTVIFQFAFGMLGSNREAKGLLVAGMAAGLAGLALMTVSGTFPMLVLSVVILRAGTGAYHPVGNALISREFKGSELKSAMGILYAGGDVGVLMTLAVTALTIGSLGWRAPPVFLVIFTGVLIAFLLVLRGTGGARRSETVPADAKRDFIQVIRDHPRVLAFGFVAGGIFNLTFNYGALLMTGRCGVDPSTASVVMAVWIASGVAIASCYGRIAKTGLERWILLSATLLMVVMTIVMTLTRDIFLMTGSLLVIGFGLFVLFPAVQANMAGTAAPGRESQSFAMLFNFQIGAGAVFSFIAGAISDVYGIASVPFLITGLSLLAIALLILCGPAIFEKR